ncbi:DHA2 family efflux MFS transporter permease subunit [Salinicoccus cyprini]|uniref:DHA2 family efflux MFS transporter permease subunit n=1 Tax=Salinicoccus cyprini TaxID=2493691 RepID=A0A558AYD6_9STAP|nr:DHA2 family efflux MFS transporter permease subunit [Salinicoccus cyprini]TVT29276.1 DHA2 family efflux MFS transporter permease subunit [Salinicoccus cyprini]
MQIRMAYRPSQKSVLIATLMMGSFLVLLNQMLLVTVVPPIMEAFGILFSTAQWLTTGFFLVNGIMIPVSAFLIHKFTSRRLYLLGMAIFIMGTVLAAVAPIYPVLLGGRILQGIAAGIMMPLTQVILLTQFPLEQRGRAMGYYGLVIGVAPAIGPPLAGYIVGFWPWRTLFLIVLPLVLANFILAYFSMRNVTHQTDPKVDISSIVLSTLGFGGLLYGFSVAGTRGWGDPLVLLSIIAGMILVFIFTRRQLGLDQPILEMSVFKNRYFLISSLVGVIVFTSMVSANNILPVLMQDMLDYTPFESGLALLPGALIMGVTMPIAGVLFDKFGIRILTFLGMALILVTSILMSFLNQETTFTYLAVVYTFRLLGTGLTLMPLTTFAMNALHDDLIPDGTAMNNTMRQIGGSIFTAVMVTIMTGVALNLSSGAPSVSEEITGVNMSFVFSAVMAGVGLVLTLFMKEQN